MDRVPSFKLNDRVRIMQTTPMQQRGIANSIGRIIRIDMSAMIADIVNDIQRYNDVPLSSLMKWDK
jgi:hypothetical protein